MAGMSRDLCANDHYLNEHLARQEKRDHHDRFTGDYISREREAIEEFVKEHSFLEQFIEDNMDKVDSELEHRAQQAWESFIEDDRDEN